MRTILTDCDGVLLNWNEAFTRWMESRGMPLLRNDSYEISVRHGISKGQAFNLVCEFNESRAVSTLLPQDDAIEWVRRLHFEHGFVFTVISALSDSDQAHTYRQQNLYNIFGPECFDCIICVPCGASKEKVLRRFAPNLWWIEDKPENAVLGRALGFRSLLYTLDHNRDFKTDIPRVENWQQIFNIVTTS